MFRHIYSYIKLLILVNTITYAGFYDSNYDISGIRGTNSLFEFELDERISREKLLGIDDNVEWIQIISSSSTAPIAYYT